ncbi:DMT family transporter [Arthrobacter sp.]|uniref:DMT family transporter n=1 Tax=Arthrobacter sp. TaxID=1667 RepID=UPI00339084F3
MHADRPADSPRGSGGRVHLPGGRAPAKREGIQLPVPLALLLALVAGVGLAVQSRLNSQLGIELQDSVGAALVSFGTGLAAVVLFALVRPKVRVKLQAVPRLLRRRVYPRWYLLAGVVGALYVFAQAATVGPIGLSLFTIAIVTGQMASGLLMDRLGIGAGRKIAVSGARITGAVLAFLAAIIAASAHFGPSRAIGPLVLFMLIPLLSGLLQSVQQGVLGQIGTAHGSPVISTLLNFGVGTVALLAVWAVRATVIGQADLLTGRWWLYLGGPLGTLILAAATVCVASTGVLLMTLTVIGGQLVGALAVDVFWPSAGSVVGPETLLGIGLTGVGLLIAAGAGRPPRPR